MQNQLPPAEDTPDLKEGKEMSFWDHLDELRGNLFRIAIGILACMLVVFFNKKLVFDGILFAPRNSDFIIYRKLCELAQKWDMPALCPDPFSFEIVNLNLSGQFMTHISTSFWFGFILSFPWIIYQLWLFISPALYAHEKKYSVQAFLFGSFLFFCGVLVAYFMVFPLTIRFFSTYELSEIGTIKDTISLSSYIGTFTTLTLAMGIVFELPMVILILSRIGIVTKKFLRKYRRHAILIIMFTSAIITPSADPFTMIAVGIPIVLLYEFSIWLCKE